jgi:cyanophycin synthetase
LLARRLTDVPEIDTAEPHHAFEDSRRLTGANRYYAQPAVVLTPLGPAAEDGAAQGRWLAFVHSACLGLQWPAPRPRVHLHAGGVILAFAAPPEVLFTATEVNEWAWERAAACHAGHVATGFDLAQPAQDNALAHFAARAAHERSGPVARLTARADALAVPWLLDDDSLSLGEGRNSLLFARAALPLPLDVPWPQLHAVPKVLVSGSNGKTTTTRLLAAMARAAGLTPGLCGTEGVVVAGQLVAAGDYAGPAGARLVLRHPDVQVALLETARGGILRRGLAVQQADLAVLTNISADHLGEQGVDSLHDIAVTKLVLAHAVAPHGTLVLNGQDHTLLRAATHLHHVISVPWALFAREHHAHALQMLREDGGSTCGADEGRLLLTLKGFTHDLGKTREMPLSWENAAAYNIDNLAAAALSAALLGWPLAAIRHTLRSFGQAPQDNPGRLERWFFEGATVLIDYAHNPDGLQHLLQVAQALKPLRVGLLLGQAGNRDNAAIGELARTAAHFVPQRIVIKELHSMLRGRSAGEVPALIEQALLGAGVPPAHITQQADEATAARELLAWAQAGDVVVLPIHTAAARDSLTGPGGLLRSS